MKKSLKFISIVLVAVIGMLIITGCAPKRKELKFKGEEGSITFNVKEDSGYKISTNSDDLRTSREQGVLIGKDFKIGIEFNDDLDYFFDGDFNKLKDARKDRDDYKEVTYGDYKGIQYFYGGYMCYNVILKIEGSKDYFLELSVYGAEDNEKAAKEAIKNEEVLDVLNNITEITAKK